MRHNDPRDLQRRECGVDGAFSGDVEMRGPFVEDQDFRVALARQSELNERVETSPRPDRGRAPTGGGGKTRGRRRRG